MTEIVLHNMVSKATFRDGTKIGFWIRDTRKFGSGTDDKNIVRIWETERPKKYRYKGTTASKENEGNV